MPLNIDPETIHVDDLPGIWSPVQWELTEDERIKELEDQATASLLWTVDMPEALLRLALDETTIERTLEPPPGYDGDLQGEWDPSLVTFQFTRAFRLVTVHRESDRLYVEYNIEGLGDWAIDIEPENLQIYRL